MKQQREDSHLLGKIQDLDNGGTGGGYVADDDGRIMPQTLTTEEPGGNMQPMAMDFSGTHPQVPSYARLFPSPWYPAF